jgi:transcriptional regulator with XRE-family HTH domain
MNWIRERRKELRLTQEDLTRLLQLEGFDYQRSAIGHWETGHNTPPTDDPAFVAALAKILKLDHLTILQMSGHQIRIHHSEEAERIARLIDELPADRRKLALKLVEQLMD